MKRLSFKPEFRDKVQDGTKRFTSRWRSQYLVVGDIVAATEPKNGNPAFLTKAEEGFATLRITSVDTKFWQDFTEADAADCGVTRDWYLRERPDAKELDRIWKYGFEVVE